MSVGINGERLKEIRKDHGDTQEDLARKLDFSVSTIRKWEQECCDPSLETLVQICRLYQVSSDYLLNLSKIDPLLYRQKQHSLSAESQQALKLFEDFLIYSEQA